ncbi:uncharacterized protein [Anabrus simplex]|uniref:uncharacterized protein n=1 Tax=Anabrus simplex TaxID=316456 RepID=UPI0035A3250C
MADGGAIRLSTRIDIDIKTALEFTSSLLSAVLQKNLEHVSEVIALKEEVKSELTEPESSQENSLEPSEDTKEEIFIEEHTDDQLLPYIKEETKRGATVCGTPWVAEHVDIRELQLEDDTRVVEGLGRTPKETENSTSSWEDVLKKREMVIEQREEAFEKKAKDVEKARKERGVGESM